MEILKKKSTMKFHQISENHVLSKEKLSLNILTTVIC